MSDAARERYGFGARCTRVEREARLVVVEEAMFRRLLSPAQIERSLGEEFGVNHRTIRTYMQRVRERWRLRAKSDPDPRITRELLTESVVDVYNACRDRLRNVDGRQVPDPDNRTALRCLYALADLHGLRVQRHEISGPNGQPLSMSPSDAAADLAKAIDRVVSRATSGGDEGSSSKSATTTSEG